MSLTVRLTDDETRELITSYQQLVDAIRALDRSLPWGMFAGAGIDVDSEPLAHAFAQADTVATTIAAAERRALTELTAKENTHA